MSLVLVGLRVILTQSKEEVVLGRLQQLGLTVCFTDAVGGDVEAGDAVCTHEPAAAEITEATNPDRMFAKYVRLAALCIDDFMPSMITHYRMAFLFLS